MKNLWLVLLLAMGSAQAQNTLVFTAETTTGTETVVPVLTWSTTPAADGCDASGDWSGAKGPDGTETLAAISSGATYNLTCSWFDGAATLTWTAPTENTDGTPLTDLAGYKLYRGPAQGNYADEIDIPSASTTTYVDGPLPPDVYCYVVTAVNIPGIESAFSNGVCKDVGLSSDVKSVGISVNPRPNAPTSLAIS